MPEFHGLALMYNKKLKDSKNLFLHTYGKDLVRAFRTFQDMGYLEIITCGATHGFLPLMSTNKNAVRAQVAVAVDHYTKTFGRPPKGIWLPECGFYPGLTRYLKKPHTFLFCRFTRYNEF
jgi:1,4-alpha-glucan branching enzyme